MPWAPHLQATVSTPHGTAEVTVEADHPYGIRLDVGGVVAAVASALQEPLPPSPSWALTVTDVHVLPSSGTVLSLTVSLIGGAATLSPAVATQALAAAGVLAVDATAVAPALCNPAYAVQGVHVNEDTAPLRLALTCAAAPGVTLGACAGCTALFKDGPTLEPHADGTTLAGTLLPHAYGGATLTLAVANATLDVPFRVVGVNDAPLAPELSSSWLEVFEDSGPLVVDALVNTTALSGGPGEAVQTVAVTVSSSSPHWTTLFSQIPSVATDGSLHATLLPDAHGRVQLALAALDSEGGVSPSVVFTLAVTPVEDPPAVVQPVVRTSAASGTVSKVLSPGAREASQHLTIHGLDVSTAPMDVCPTCQQPPALAFATPPSFTPFGALDFDAVPNTAGVALLTGNFSDGVAPPTPFTVRLEVAPPHSAPACWAAPATTALAVHEDTAALSFHSTVVATNPNAAVYGVAPVVSAVSVSLPGQTPFDTATSDLLSDLVLFPNGTLGLLVARDAFGTASIEFTCSDATGASAPPSSFDIVIANVNDPPTLEAAPFHGPAVGGTTHYHTVVAALSPGPGPESATQAAYVTLVPEACTNLHLFAVPPSLTHDNVLVMRPTAFASGEALLGFVATDTGSPPLNSTLAFVSVSMTPGSRPVVEYQHHVTVPGVAFDYAAPFSAPVVRTAGNVVTVDPPSQGPVEGLSIAAISPTPCAVTDAVLFSQEGTTSMNVSVAPGEFGACTVTVNDHWRVLSPVATVAIVVDVAFEPSSPSFTMAPNVSVASAADDTPVAIANWAQRITPGSPAEEAAGESVRFSVLPLAGGDLLSTPPSVSPDGKLSLGVAPHANGIASFTVTAVDAGGQESPPLPLNIAIQGVASAAHSVFHPPQTDTLPVAGTPVLMWVALADAEGVAVGPGPALPPVSCAFVLLEANSTTSERVSATYPPAARGPAWTPADVSNSPVCAFTPPHGGILLVHLEVGGVGAALPDGNATLVVLAEEPNPLPAASPSPAPLPVPWGQWCALGVQSAFAPVNNISATFANGNHTTFLPFGDVVQFEVGRRGFGSSCHRELFPPQASFHGVAGAVFTSPNQGASPTAICGDLDDPALVRAPLLESTATPGVLTFAGHAVHAGPGCVAVYDTSMSPRTGVVVLRPVHIMPADTFRLYNTNASTTSPTVMTLQAPFITPGADLLITVGPVGSALSCASPTVVEAGVATCHLPPSTGTSLRVTLMAIEYVAPGSGTYAVTGLHTYAETVSYPPPAVRLTTVVTPGIVPWLVFHGQNFGVLAHHLTIHVGPFPCTAHGRVPVTSIDGAAAVPPHNDTQFACVLPPNAGGRNHTVFVGAGPTAFNTHFVTVGFAVDLVQAPPTPSAAQTSLSCDVMPGDGPVPVWDMVTCVLTPRDTAGYDMPVADAGNWLVAIAEESMEMPDDVLGAPFAWPPPTSWVGLPPTLHTLEGVVAVSFKVPVTPFRLHVISRLDGNHIAGSPFHYAEVGEPAPEALLPWVDACWVEEVSGHGTGTLVLPPYNGAQTCGFTLDLSGVGATGINITLVEFDTEQHFDFLSIWDGANATAPQLAYVSGQRPNATFTTSGPQALVAFHADYAGGGSGFTLAWEAVYTPRPPPPPTNLILTSVDDRSAVFFVSPQGLLLQNGSDWLANGGKVTSFVANVQEDPSLYPSPASLTVTVPVGTALSAGVAVTGLQPGIWYHFTVVLEGELGTGPPSTVNRFRTAPAVPEAPVVTRVVATRGGAALTLSPIAANGQPVTAVLVEAALAATAAWKHGWVALSTMEVDPVTGYVSGGSSVTSASSVALPAVALPTSGDVWALRVRAVNVLGASGASPVVYAKADSCPDVATVGVPLLSDGGSPVLTLVAPSAAQGAVKAVSNASTLVGSVHGNVLRLHTGNLLGNSAEDIWVAIGTPSATTHTILNASVPVALLNNPVASGGLPPVPGGSACAWCETFFHTDRGAVFVAIDSGVVIARPLWQAADVTTAMGFTQGALRGLIAGASNSTGASLGVAVVAGATLQWLAWGEGAALEASQHVGDFPADAIPPGHTLDVLHMQLADTTGSGQTDLVVDVAVVDASGSTTAALCGVFLDFVAGDPSAFRLRSNGTSTPCHAVAVDADRDGATDLVTIDEDTAPGCTVFVNTLSDIPYTVDVPVCPLGIPARGSTWWDRASAGGRYHTMHLFQEPRLATAVGVAPAGDGRFTASFDVAQADVWLPEHGTLSPPASRQAVPVAVTAPGDTPSGLALLRWADVLGVGDTALVFVEPGGDVKIVETTPLPLNGAIMRPPDSSCVTTVAANGATAFRLSLVDATLSAGATMSVMSGQDTLFSHTGSPPFSSALSLQTGAAVTVLELNGTTRAEVVVQHDSADVVLTPEFVGVPFPGAPSSTGFKLYAAPIAAMECTPSEVGLTPTPPAAGRGAQLELRWSVLPQCTGSTYVSIVDETAAARAATQLVRFVGSRQRTAQFDMTPGSLYSVTLVSRDTNGAAVGMPHSMLFFFPTCITPPGGEALDAPAAFTDGSPTGTTYTPDLDCSWVVHTAPGEAAATGVLLTVHAADIAEGDSLKFSISEEYQATPWETGEPVAVVGPSALVSWSTDSFHEAGGWEVAAVTTTTDLPPAPPLHLNVTLDPPGVPCVGTCTMRAVWDAVPDALSGVAGGTVASYTIVVHHNDRLVAVATATAPMLTFSVSGVACGDGLTVNATATNTAPLLSVPTPTFHFVYPALPCHLTPVVPSPVDAVDGSVADGSGVLPMLLGQACSWEVESPISFWPVQVSVTRASLHYPHATLAVLDGSAMRLNCVGGNVTCGGAPVYATSGTAAIVYDTVVPAGSVPQLPPPLVPTLPDTGFEVGWHVDVGVPALPEAPTFGPRHIGSTQACVDIHWPQVPWSYLPDIGEDAVLQASLGEGAVMEEFVDLRTVVAGARGGAMPDPYLFCHKLPPSNTTVLTLWARVRSRNHVGDTTSASRPVVLYGNTTAAKLEAAAIKAQLSQFPGYFPHGINVTVLEANMSSLAEIQTLVFGEVGYDVDLASFLAWLPGTPPVPSSRMVQLLGFAEDSASAGVVISLQSADWAPAANLTLTSLNITVVSSEFSVHGGTQVWLSGYVHCVSSGWSFVQEQALLSVHHGTTPPSLLFSSALSAADARGVVATVLSGHGDMAARADRLLESAGSFGYGMTFVLDLPYASTVPRALTLLVAPPPSNDLAQSWPVSPDVIPGLQPVSKLKAAVLTLSQAAHASKAAALDTSTTLASIDIHQLSQHAGPQTTVYQSSVFRPMVMTLSVADVTASWPLPKDTLYYPSSVSIAMGSYLPELVLDVLGVDGAQPIAVTVSTATIHFHGVTRPAVYHLAPRVSPPATLPTGATFVMTKHGSSSSAAIDSFVAKTIAKDASESVVVSNNYLWTPVVATSSRRRASVLPPQCQRDGICANAVNFKTTAASLGRMLPPSLHSLFNDVPQTAQALVSSCQASTLSHELPGRIVCGIVFKANIDFSSLEPLKMLTSVLPFLKFPSSVVTVVLDDAEPLQKWAVSTEVSGLGSVISEIVLTLSAPSAGEWDLSIVIPEAHLPLPMLFENTLVAQLSGTLSSKQPGFVRLEGQLLENNKFARFLLLPGLELMTAFNGKHTTVACTEPEVNPPFCKDPFLDLTFRILDSDAVLHGCLSQSGEDLSFAVDILDFHLADAFLIFGIHVPSALARAANDVLTIHSLHAAFRSSKSAPGRPSCAAAGLSNAVGFQAKGDVTLLGLDASFDLAFTEAATMIDITVKASHTSIIVKAIKAYIKFVTAGVIDLTIEAVSFKLQLKDANPGFAFSMTATIAVDVPSFLHTSKAAPETKTVSLSTFDLTAGKPWDQVAKELVCHVKDTLEKYANSKLCPCKDGSGGDSCKHGLAAIARTSVLVGAAAVVLRRELEPAVDHRELFSLHSFTKSVSNVIKAPVKVLSKGLDTVKKAGETVFNDLTCGVFEHQSPASMLHHAGSALSGASHHVSSYVHHHWRVLQEASDAEAFLYHPCVSREEVCAPLEPVTLCEADFPCSWSNTTGVVVCQGACRHLPAAAMGRTGSRCQPTSKPCTEALSGSLPDVSNGARRLSCVSRIVNSLHAFCNSVFDEACKPGMPLRLACDAGDAFLNKLGDVVGC